MTDNKRTIRGLSKNKKTGYKMSETMRSALNALKSYSNNLVTYNWETDEEFSSIYDVIGDRIRFARKALKFSQKQLADMVHISQKDLNDYENGDRPIKSLCLWDISKALDVNINYFFRDFI